MKRLLRATFFVGAISLVVVWGLHAGGLLHAPESGLRRIFFRDSAPNDGSGIVNFLISAIVAFGVAWSALAIPELSRRGLLLFLLFADLIGAAWILGLAGVAFQPLPAILVAAIAAPLAAGFGATHSARQRRAIEELFSDRLAQSAVDRLTKSETLDLAEPKSCEVSFVFCQIANQAALVEELPPAKCAQLTRDFAACASELFRRENGYLHAADGEGVRVVFGFPEEAGENCAVAAARAALAFRERFAAEAKEQRDSLGKIDLRIGISSGPIVATMRSDSRGREILLAGEPLERARRLALANHIYGSRILLGPRTYNMASVQIVARPLDFLRSVEAHDPLEVYELLTLAGQANADELGRRDHFWNGVVYFRARRWNAAFLEFCGARRDGEVDEPLNWYLRRLEPLLLRMTTEPAPVVEPLSSLETR